MHLLRIRDQHRLHAANIDRDAASDGFGDVTQVRFEITCEALADLNFGGEGKKCYFMKK